MNSRERVLSALDHRGYDRIPVCYDGTPEISAQMMETFGLKTHEDLLRLVGDDCRYMGAKYVGPELRKFPDGSWEGVWGERYNLLAFEGGSYPEAVYLPFAEVDSVADLQRDKFPTADWWDFSELKAQATELRKEFAVCWGNPGEMDFINGISRARGMERVLMDLITEDPVFMEIMNARYRYHYDCHERALAACEGLIDIVHIGEDLGNQLGPMISMEIFDKLFAPKFGAYFKMAHAHGARTAMHMCGCVNKFLPRLMELGLDIYDVVQPTTPENEIATLVAEHGNDLSYRGTMCVQTTLPWGTVQDVEHEVQRRLKLFPKGGLLLGPTHAIQVRTPIENVVAMYRAAGSLAPEAADVLVHMS